MHTSSKIITILVIGPVIFIWSSLPCRYSTSYIHWCSCHIHPTLVFPPWQLVCFILCMVTAGLFRQLVSQGSYSLLHYSWSFVAANQSCQLIAFDKLAASLQGEQFCCNRWSAVAACLLWQLVCCGSWSFVAETRLAAAFLLQPVCCCLFQPFCPDSCYVTAAGLFYSCSDVSHVMRAGLVWHGITIMWQLVCFIAVLMSVM